MQQVDAAGLRKRLAPPPKLTVSSWADRHRVLPRESSAAPGQWDTARTPYLRAIMDAFSEPLIERIVFMKSAQVGATEVLLNVIGFHIDRDPAPILVVQPSVKPAAESFSKDRLAPMIRDSPRLTDRVRDPRSRDSGNTILHKVFPGGQITVVGANSPAGLASRPIRILLLDEVDRYEASAGTEGDPVRLAIQRTETFWNRKIALFSTPGIKGLSRIEREWLLSDQRRYEVPCPHCGAFQVLSFRTGLKFAVDARGDVAAESVHYECGHCHGAIEESQKGALIAAGRWRPMLPGRRVAGFHINALYSPWARWPDIAQTFVEAKDDQEQLKAFVNLKLGELWEDRGEQLDATALEERAERYGEAEVPAGVGILTAGVDVQASRLELEVVGWGAGEESWRIAHYRLEGDTEQPATWQALEALLTRAYRHASGAALRIRVCLIDSGYRTPTVYGFVRPRQARGVYASKGEEGTRGQTPLRRAAKTNRYGVRPFTIATAAMKDTLFARLKIQQPGPRYMHFRTMLPDGGFDGEFFAQLGAEKVVLERRGARRIRRYVAVRDRNEAIDLEVLNLAALHALGTGLREQLGKLADRIGPPVQTSAEVPAGVAAPTPPAPKRRPSRPRGGGWLHGWR